MSSNRRSSLGELRAVLKGWGGALRLCDSLPTSRSTFCEAPFAWGELGIDFSRKIVYAAGNFPVGGLIHEAGHVFASHKEPGWAGCESLFLGWEFLLARKVGLLEEWYESMDGYVLHGMDFGDMNEDKRSDVIEQYVELARASGLVVGEEPISIRK